MEFCHVHGCGNWWNCRMVKEVCSKLYLTLKIIIYQIYKKIYISKSNLFQFDESQCKTNNKRQRKSYKSESESDTQKRTLILALKQSLEPGFCPWLTNNRTMILLLFIIMASPVVCWSWYHIFHQGLAMVNLVSIERLVL